LQNRRADAIPLLETAVSRLQALEEGSLPSVEVRLALARMLVDIEAWQGGAVVLDSVLSHEFSLTEVLLVFYVHINC
jgi:hypothetical protein